MSSQQVRFLLGVVSLIALSCGSTALTRCATGVSEQDCTPQAVKATCTEYWTTYCARQRRCLGITSGCDEIEKTCELESARPNAAVNRPVFEACLNSLKNDACESAVAGDECTSIILGGGTDGIVCGTSRDCQPKFWCDDVTTCPSVCRPRVALDQTTPNPGACEKNTYNLKGRCVKFEPDGNECSDGKQCLPRRVCNNANRCEPLPTVAVEEGQPCAGLLNESCRRSIDKILRCIDDVCKRPAPDGSTCTSSKDCLNTCERFPDNTFRCIKYPQLEGGTCVSALGCAQGLFCDAPDINELGTCKRFLPVGALCNISGPREACGESAFCTAPSPSESNMCKPRKREGEACNASTLCMSQLICEPGPVANMGTCRALKSEGDTCTSGLGECTSGLTCSVANGPPAGTCQAPKPLGAACISGERIGCASALICSTTSGRCSEKRNAGEACESNEQCYFRCQRNLCVGCRQ
jgi:hypothetical protein